MTEEEVTKPAPLLDETGLANSPFERWPGHVKFPEVMGRNHYRIFTQHRDATKDDEADEDALKIMVRVEDGSPRAVRMSDLDLAEKVVEEISLGDINPFSDDAPIKIIHWIVECTEEWLDSQLSFRVRSGGDVAQ